MLFVLQLEIESMARYVSPVNPAVFPHLALLLLSIGVFFTAWFFVYEVTATKMSRDIFKELLVSLVAAIFSGFGIQFLLLWVGIYVWFSSQIFFDLHVSFQCITLLFLFANYFIIKYWIGWIWMYKNCNELTKNLIYTVYWIKLSFSVFTVFFFS